MAYYAIHNKMGKFNENILQNCTCAAHVVEAHVCHFKVKQQIIQERYLKHRTRIL